jgi:hypothetical protein
MRKKKVDVLRPNNIWDSECIKISNESNKYFFEIMDESTTDLSEAVAILMRKVKSNDKIWSLKINDIDLYNIEPSKCLYWLSGGDEEWMKMEHYKKPWFDCYMDYQEEFGVIIISILKRSKTLKDVRDGFIKYLNLPILYNFAIERGII